MYELFRAKAAGDPKICHSNFIDRAGPLTETILLGNLAVWAASKAEPTVRWAIGRESGMGCEGTEGDQPRLAEDTTRRRLDQA